MVVGLVVVPGRVTTLEGVTTVRVTVLVGLVVVAVDGLTVVLVLELETVEGVVVPVAVG